MKPKVKERVDKIKSFLKEKAPKLLDVVDDYFPPAKMLTTLINDSPDMKPEDKVEALKLANELKLAEEETYRDEIKQITERHKSDMLSDSWMSKNIRPYTLVYLLLFLSGLIISDSASINFNVDDAYVELLKYLLISVFLFYFGGRELTKIMTVTRRK